MTKISKKSAYPVKIPVRKDYFVGTDSENNGKTVNFDFESTAKLINELNGTPILNYIFKTDNNIPLAVLTDGVFLSEGNETTVSNISKLYINKKNFHEEDMSDLFRFIAVNREVFIMKLRNSSNLANGVYFRITDATEFENHFILDVAIELSNTAVPELVNFNLYFFDFELNSSNLAITLPEFNKIVTQTGYTSTETTITFNPFWTWLIKNVSYENSASVVKTIDTATTGKKRIDVFVLNTSNTFETISGEETTGSPVKPQIPADTLEVTFCIVGDTGIETVEPIDLSAYATRQYVDDKDALKVDKVTGKSLIADSEITRLSTVTNFDNSANVTALDSKVEKVVGERLINNAEIVKLGNQSGTNTGDETLATIKTKLGITTLSGSNTGDQDLSGLAPKASPTFTGTPTAPTATLGTNSNQIATTAYVLMNGGSSAIVNNNVWVSSGGNDSTGLISRQDKPFLTVNAALDALGVSGGVVNIGIGSFNSPLYSKIKSNTVFKGSGKPKYNNTVTGGASYPLYTKTTATGLSGGTIFLGEFRIPFDSENIQIYDLGVDAGFDWCSAFNGGTATEGLMIANGDYVNTTQNGKLLRKNIVVKNVATIVKGSADMVHSFLIENCYEPYLDNIDTYNGFAGFVYKNIGGTATNIKSCNSGQYGIIIKTNSYAYSNSVFLNGFEIDGGTGLSIHDEGDATGMQNVYIANGRIKNTSYGVKQIGTLIKYLNMTNIFCSNISGTGFDFSNAQYSNFLSCVATSCAGGGLKIIGINNRISECRATSNTGVGIDIRCGAGSFPCISTGNDSSSNSTYGFSYTGDVRGGHNVAIGNTSGATLGTISLIDSGASVSVPLSLIGSVSGYTPVLNVENTGTTAAEKNVSVFSGNRGSDTSVDDNTTVGIRQKNTTAKNYSNFSFWNSAFNTVATISARNISSTLPLGSLAFFTGNNSALLQVMELSSAQNVLIGKPEFTGVTNNDTGEKLQVVGIASITGVIKAGAQVRLKNYTVSTLPAGVQGDTAYVTDALSPTYMATVVGGGAVVTPVFYNGTNWVAH